MPRFEISNWIRPKSKFQFGVKWSCPNLKLGQIPTWRAQHKYVPDQNADLGDRRLTQYVDHLTGGGKYNLVTQIQSNFFLPIYSSTFCHLIILINNINVLINLI